MRAPVSVIIPTLNAAGELPGCLAALGEGLQEGLIREVVITDGGSTDATPDIAEAAGAVWVGPAPSAAGLGPGWNRAPPSPLGGEGWGEGDMPQAGARGAQLRRGAGAAGGAWLLFLHADTWLAPGWTAAVLHHLARSQEAAWFRLAFRTDAPGGRPPWQGEGGARSGGADEARLAGPMPGLVAGWANLRARAGLPYGDQGLLLPRSIYDAVGGYPELPLMEDVAMARRLRGRLRGLPAVAETSAARYLERGWLRQGGGNLWRLARYLAGADPARLAEAYGRPRPK
jgi:GT2 family glycosyltransferase